MSNKPKVIYAFPLDGDYGAQNGMTLRDWFAGQAISQSFLANRWADEDSAKYAYAIADAMLAERAKGEQNDD